MAQDSTCSADGWLSAPDGTGPSLAARIEREVAERRINGSLSESEEKRLCELSVFFSPETFSTSPARLELLRAMCRTFNVEFKPEVTPSHRKVLGPIVAGIKRAMVPFLRALLGPIFVRQAEFNASVVKLLGELSNERQR